MFIEIIFLASEASCWDHEISEGTFEVFPVVDVVEHGNRDGFNLGSDEVWEELKDGLNQKFESKALVGVHCVRLSICLNRLLNHIVLNKFDELLDDLALEFETREMSTIRHDFQGLLQDGGVEGLVKDGANLRRRPKLVVEVPKTFQTNFHNLWFFMFHGENDSMDNCLEHLTLQLEHTRCAMVHDIMNKLEEWFSEVWVVIKVVHDDI